MPPRVKRSTSTPAFRAQRQRLLHLASNLRQDEQPVFTPSDAELLDGLLNLTDSIADQAADRHGIDCLLKAPEEAQACDAEGVLEPEDRMERLVEELGLTGEDVDELVHDVTSETASDVNNEGLFRQIEYLIDKLGPEAAERDLRFLAERKGESPTTKCECEEPGHFCSGDHLQRR